MRKSHSSLNHDGRESRSSSFGINVLAKVDEMSEDEDSDWEP